MKKETFLKSFEEALIMEIECSVKLDAKKEATLSIYKCMGTLRSVLQSVSETVEITTKNLDECDKALNSDENLNSTQVGNCTDMGFILMYLCAKRVLAKMTKDLIDMHVQPSDHAIAAPVQDISHPAVFTPMFNGNEHCQHQSNVIMNKEMFFKKFAEILQREINLHGLPMQQEDAAQLISMCTTIFIKALLPVSETAELTMQHLDECDQAIENVFRKFPICMTDVAARYAHVILDLIRKDMINADKQISNVDEEVKESFEEKLARELLQLELSKKEVSMHVQHSAPPSYADSVLTQKVEEERNRPDQDGSVRPVILSVVPPPSYCQSELEATDKEFFRLYFT